MFRGTARPTKPQARNIRGRAVYTCARNDILGRMELRADAHLHHPRPIVFAAYRDKLTDLLPFLPNVRGIDIKARADDGPRTTFHNVWNGGGDIPAAARAFVSEAMLSWSDYATWNADDFTCSWRIETHAMSEAIQCRGINTFKEEAGGTLLEIRGTLEIDAKKIRGIPGLLAGKAGKMIEEFMGARIQPNLVAVSKGLGQYLDDRGGKL